MNENKIGIITFHCSYNFGSALQAFALERYLQKKEFTTEIIDFRSEDFEKYRIFKFKLYSKYPKAVITDILRLFPNLVRRWRYRCFWKKYLEISSNKFGSRANLSILNSKYKAFICGSDQIWNPYCTNSVIKQFYLDFVADDKIKVAYGPSIAQESIEKSYLDIMVPLIKRLNYISVREKSVAYLLKEKTGRKISVVLDPTLLLECEDYEELVSNKNFKNKYLLIYCLEENEELYNYAENIAVSDSLEIFYFNKTQKKFKVKSHNYYYNGPVDFLCLVKNAEFIISNSFHATVFSVIFKKKFLTWGTEHSASRMKDFLLEVGLSRRLFPGGEAIEKNIDYTKVMSKIKTLKRSSEEYLISALKEV